MKDKYLGDDFAASLNYGAVWDLNLAGKTRGARNVTAPVAKAFHVSLASKSGGTGSWLSEKKLRVLVACDGIGGLVFTLVAKRKGFEVVVFEKDISGIRGEGQYRGPIQIESNALAALEAMDMTVAEEVMQAGCITGDRTSGLVDGISATW
ncbi:hypothetical protein Ancab_003793 [Ancistrocladus abbreviatus]